MSRDFALNEDFDLDVSGNDFNLVSDGAEVAQNSSIRLLFIQTEWVYNYTLGTPWYDVLFSTEVSYEVKRATLIDVITSTPGFKNMIEFKFSIDLQNKGALVEYKANTVFGNEPITQRITR